jgi:hypothetical protein
MNTAISSDDIPKVKPKGRMQSKKSSLFSAQQLDGIEPVSSRTIIIFFVAGIITIILVLLYERSHPFVPAINTDDALQTRQENTPNSSVDEVISRAWPTAKAQDPIAFTFKSGPNASPIPADQVIREILHLPSGVSSPRVVPRENEIQFSLMTRTFSGRRHQVLAALPCFEVILPGSAFEVV